MFSTALTLKIFLQKQKIVSAVGSGRHHPLYGPCPLPFPGNVSGVGGGVGSAGGGGAGGVSRFILFLLIVSVEVIVNTKYLHVNLTTGLYLTHICIILLKFKYGSNESALCGRCCPKCKSGI